MITQTQTKRWRVELESNWTGHRRRWRQTFDTKPEALAYQVKIQQQLALEKSHKTQILDPGITLATAWSEHCEQRVKKLGRTPTVHDLGLQEKYKKRGQFVIERLPENIRIADISLAEVSRYIQGRRDNDEVTESSIRNELSGLSTMVKHMKRRGISMPYNPFQAALADVGERGERDRRLSQLEHDVLDEAFEYIQAQARQRLIVNGQIQPLFKNLDLPGGNIEYEGTHDTLSLTPAPRLLQLHTAFVLAISTTLRASKLFSIKWSDIKRAGAGYEYIEVPAPTTRNKKNPQRIPVSPRLADALQAARHWATGGPNDFILGDLKRHHCYLILRKIAEIHGWKPLRWHDLRHEGISQLADAGWTATQIQTISGHRTLSMLSRYVHHDVDQIHALMMKKQ